MRYRLDAHVVDQATRTLSGADGEVHVEPQVFELLVYLIRNRDRAIAKTELLDEIWGDQFVSESALTTRVKSARIALGDNGRRQASIRTLHGFGYQFIGQVVEEVRPEGARPASGGESPFAPGASGGVSLPDFHTPLRGRLAEFEELSSLVARHPMVTVVGPGGIGKTRLTVEVAIAMCERPGACDHAVFVDLAATRDAAAVPSALADVLHIETGQRSDPLDAACEFLSAIPHMVLLDNCEHVLPAAASVAAAITQRCPGTKIIATSREPLALPSERLYRLGTLPLLSDADVLTPERVEENPAAAVFLDRARQVDHDLTLDARQARQVVELCRALDGLPLALELAAGRLATYGLDDLVTLLDRRLDLLGDRGTAREHRHRTLRATVEWSYDNLDADLQRLFRTLSVFPTGISISGVDRLAAGLGLDGDGIEAVGQLVDASLMTRTETPSGSRYGQLETLRTYGLDRLEHHGETDSARELAVSWMLELAAQIGEQIQTDAEPIWIDRVRHEFPNLRAARHFLAESDRDPELLDLSRHLARWARMGDAAEVWDWADDLVRRSSNWSAADRAAALAMRAQGLWRRGDIAGAIASASEALADSDDPWTRSLAFAELGAANLFAGQLGAALDCWYSEGALNDSPVAWGSSAIVAAYMGDIKAARQHAERARERAAVGGVPSAIAWAEYAAAEVENSVGLAEVAPLETAIEIARSVDAKFLVGVAMTTLASVHKTRGETLQAATRYEELIRHWLRMGSWTQQWTTLRHVAELLEADEPEVAWVILQSAQADPLSPPALAEASAELLAELDDRLRSRLDDEVVHAAPVDRLAAAEQARDALTRIIGRH